MRTRAFRNFEVLGLSLLLAACGGSEEAPPTIQINTPTNGLTVSGQFRVTGTTAGEVALVLLDCGDGKFVQASGTTSWTSHCDTTLLPDGWTTMKARAIGLERQEAFSSVEVMVVNLDPIVGTWDWQPGSGGSPGHYAGSYIVFYRSGVVDEPRGVFFPSFAIGWQKQGPGVMTVQRLAAGPVTLNYSFSADGQYVTLQWPSGSQPTMVLRRRGT